MVRVCCRLAGIWIAGWAAFGALVAVEPPSIVAPNATMALTASATPPARATYCVLIRFQGLGIVLPTVRVISLSFRGASLRSSLAGSSSRPFSKFGAPRKACHRWLQWFDQPSLGAE